MNLSEWMETYFGDASAERLGAAADLGAGEARRALREGVPAQVGALAAHARTPGGAAQIAEAVQNLPPFASVEAALTDENGAGLLTQAGELLAPVLLGAGGETAADGGAGRLLRMALPLTLSFLGQRGLREENAATFLGDLAGSGGGPGVSPALREGDGSRTVISATPGTASTSEPVPAAGGPLTSAGLLDFLRGQFSPPAAERLGRAAGFSGNTAARAAEAALPVVLSALVRRGATEAGAGDLLARGPDLGGLLDPQGRLNAALLADPALTARLEGQGRGLLGPLFGNVEAVTGRLGSAIGGSGASAGRLLALLAPLVLALVGRRARAEGLGPGALAALLAGLDGQLASLLPAGLSSLGPLLTAAPGSATPTGPTLRIPAAPPPAVAETARRRGLPWWLLPLLLVLLLGGCYLLQRRPAAAVTAPAISDTAGSGSAVTVVSPTPGATGSAADLNVTGAAPASDTAAVEGGGTQAAGPGDGVGAASEAETGGGTTSGADAAND